MTSSLNEILRSTDKYDTLLISEQKQDHHTGVSINFIEVQGRLRFELYVHVVEKANLRISEQLKRYAVVKT